MKRNWIIIAALVLTAFSLAACGGDGDDDEIIMDEPVPAGAENHLKIELEFTAEEIVPDRVTVPADTDVLFVVYNSDTREGDLNEDHNLVSPEIGLREILVVPGQTVRRTWHTPSEPGEYMVGCTIHPWITMSFVVE
jgi:plastocyanin